MSIPLPILSELKPPPAPDVASVKGALFDAHGRQIKDLRLSVTDRCNFRCVYCMEPDVKYIPKIQLLNLDEYLRVIRIAMSLGIEKLRITGGEPTLYPDLDALLEEVGKLGLRDIALTTNGSQGRGQWAQRWKKFGLHRITISLDTLKPERKDAITRSKTSLHTVIEAIDHARSNGLTPVKVNAVIMRGVNDDEIADFADFAREHEIDMRLIEFMALDAGRRWERKRVFTADEMLEAIRSRHEIFPEEDPRSSTSINFRFKEGNGRIGIIASVTRAFCGNCDRMRVMADGTLRPCLFCDDEWNMRQLLRNGASDDDLRQFFIDAMWTKSAGHGMDREDFKRPEKTMSTIGG